MTQMLGPHAHADKALSLPTTSSGQPEWGSMAPPREKEVPR